MKKKIISIFLVLIMAFGIASPSFAASIEAMTSAKELNSLGLFSGVGTNADGSINFDLDRAPNRQEAITTLIGILGKQEEARSSNWTTSFTDVDDWAKPYVGYAYHNGISAGITDTHFGAKDSVTATQYISFVLNVLGYDIGKDFQWDKAWELSDCIGLTDGRYNKNTTSFTRGDMVIVSLSAYKLMEKLKTAPYFGLPEDIRWIPHPMDNRNVDNNTLYSFLIGNYTLEGTGLERYEIDYAIRDRKSVSTSYLDIAGLFMNTGSSRAGEKGNWYITYNQNIFTMEELYEQQIAALETAIQMKNELHSSGKIKKGMTEKEIAQVYYDYISSLGIVPGDGGDAAAKKGLCIQWDSAYACLVNKVADCGGRAAGFNLLMHLEGIEAQGISGETKGGGHIISRLVLDGEEYFCDWGNRKGINKNVTSWFKSDEDSLERARNM